MSTTKLVNNKRRNHAAKVLQQMSKRLGAENEVHSTEETHESGDTKRSKVSALKALRNQYEVIRKDIMKLREDLNQTYGIAREYVGNIQPTDMMKMILKAR